MCSEFHRGQRLPSFNKRPDICMQLSFEVELTHPCNAGRSIYAPLSFRHMRANAKDQGRSLPASHETNLEI